MRKAHFAGIFLSQPLRIPFDRSFEAVVDKFQSEVDGEGTEMRVFLERENELTTRFTHGWVSKASFKAQLQPLALLSRFFSQF